jgi:hypothetical protein
MHVPIEKIQTNSSLVANTEIRRNINEAFNEICVILCIYIIMLFMLSDNKRFLDDITMVFIFIVAVNVLFFAI